MKIITNMVELRKRNRCDTLIEKLDEITQLADAMIQLPVRPSIPVDDFIDFEKFDENTKYQDDLAPALRKKIKNLYPNLNPNEISKVFSQELRSAKGRLIFKSSLPSKVNNYKHG